MTAAFIAGNVSCSQPSGGESGNPGGTGGGGGNGTCVICGFAHPDYYIHEEFGGQRFVEAGKNWNNNANGYQEFTTRYNDADQFIDCKVTELNNLWQENNTNSTLSNQIGTALGNFNKGASIGQKIDKNYDVLAPVFANMLKQYDFNNDTDFVNYYKFQASYHKLAANAYNNSLGRWENTTDDRVLTNKEMKNLPENFFVKELAEAHLTYNELNVKKAQEIMNNSLEAIASRAKTNHTVLKKVVELALYNESLYGLNDLAKLDNLVSCEKLREHSLFDLKIDAEYNKLRSIDDYGRTM